MSLSTHANNPKKTESDQIKKYPGSVGCLRSLAARGRNGKPTGLPKRKREDHMIIFWETVLKACESGLDPPWQGVKVWWP